MIKINIVLYLKVEQVNFIITRNVPLTNKNNLKTLKFKLFVLNVKTNALLKNGLSNMKSLKDALQMFRNTPKVYRQLNSFLVGM